MTRDKGASVRQRRVSAELRALRESRGLTCQQVADALDCSVSKVSRTGVRGLYPDDVSAMLGYLQAPTKLREELLQLVRDGKQTNWIQTGAYVPDRWRNLIRIEADATLIQNYEPMIVPGLLQTGDYTRAVIRGANHVLTDSEVEQLVRTRMGRQGLLSGFDSPMLSVILDESVLRRPIGGPGVMYGQLCHLANLVMRPRIELRVVPWSVGANPGLEGPMMILTFADQPTLVHIEIRTTSGFVEDPGAVRRAKVAWRELRAAAMPPDDSTLFIDGLIREWRKSVRSEA